MRPTEDGHKTADPRQKTHHLFRGFALRAVWTDSILPSPLMEWDVSHCAIFPLTPALLPLGEGDVFLDHCEIETIPSTTLVADRHHRPTIKIFHRSKPSLENFGTIRLTKTGRSAPRATHPHPASQVAGQYDKLYYYFTRQPSNLCKWLIERPELYLFFTIFIFLAGKVLKGQPRPET